MIWVAAIRDGWQNISARTLNLGLADAQTLRIYLRQQNHNLIGLIGIFIK